MSTITSYRDLYQSIQTHYNIRERNKAQLEKEWSELEVLKSEYETSVEAQQLLASVSDDRTSKIIYFVTGIINKALSEIFPDNPRRVSLENTLYSGKYPHINVTLTADGDQRDLKTQSGTGLRQIISFLYRLALIEITGARKVVIADELLSGVHRDAMEVILDIINIFRDGGFQFMFVDYAMPEEVGKTYRVINQDNTAYLEEFKGGQGSGTVYTTAQATGANARDPFETYTDIGVN